MATKHTAPAYGYDERAENGAHTRMESYPADVRIEGAEYVQHDTLGTTVRIAVRQLNVDWQEIEKALAFDGIPQEAAESYVEHFCRYVNKQEMARALVERMTVL